MPEVYISLSPAEQAELLDVAAARSGRPAHILEKDVWVVWALETLFSSPLADWLTFKGGTSLSKAYNVIDRFSEDVDLTCDIRRLLSDLALAQEGVPPTSSQANRWAKAVRNRLPQWIAEHVVPVISAALHTNNIAATLRAHGKDNDSLLLEYPPVRQGSGYVAPHIRLEFGARSTGEPCETRPVACDLAPLMPEIVFPQATPRVMKMERTFWEKATAIHVFCQQGKLRGDRFARHWHDLLRLAATERVQKALPDKTWLDQVVRHKRMFFVEKDQAGGVIEYRECLEGKLCLMPEGEAQKTLHEDYNSMIRDGILLTDALAFATVLEQCATLQEQINACYR